MKEIFPILFDGKDVLAYAVNYVQGGYSIVSATQKYNPIIAFSECGSLSKNHTKEDSSLFFLLDILKEDMIIQKNNHENDSVSITNRILWREYKGEKESYSSEYNNLSLMNSSTMRDHGYWLLKERDLLMSEDKPSSSASYMMSTDMDLYNELIRRDYDNRNYLSEGKKDDLRRVNAVIQSTYKNEGVKGAFWSEIYGT